MRNYPTPVAETVSSAESHNGFGRRGNTFEHLSLQSDDPITSARNQCHIPTSYPVSLLGDKEWGDRTGIAHSV
jgi:hypothetical protein